MAVAKKAASYGAKVVLFDFVKPSPQGSKWGLGGTCVNVGCVPKKLMHYAGLLGAGMHDAKAFGWKVGNPEHDWEAMVEAVQNHVKMLNFRYRVGLKSAQVSYVNGLAKLTGPHEVTCTKRGKETKHTAARLLVDLALVGERRRGLLVETTGMVKPSHTEKHETLREAIGKKEEAAWEDERQRERY